MTFLDTHPNERFIVVSHLLNEFFKILPFFFLPFLIFFSEDSCWLTKKKNFLFLFFTKYNRRGNNADNKIFYRRVQNTFHYKVMLTYELFLITLVSSCSTKSERILCFFSSNKCLSSKKILQ